jgi:hypothetical protein
LDTLATAADTTFLQVKAEPQVLFPVPTGYALAFAAGAVWRVYADGRRELALR